MMCPSSFEVSKMLGLGTHLLLPSIALCIFFVAHQVLGSRLSPTIQEVNDPLVKDLLFAPIKKNLTSLKTISNGTINPLKGPAAGDVTYGVAHQTSAGGGPNDNYYGLHAITDVYGHDLKSSQVSATVIWVHHPGDGGESSLNSIEVGWHIHPERYGDSRPRLFAYWTRDGYETTGCFNMDCPGFVQAGAATVSLGDVIDPVSDVNGGSIQNVALKLFKDKNSGDWWVYYGFNSVPTAVGYYPRTLFTYLAKKAKNVSFGAYVIADRSLPTPPLGSGALPNGGPGQAASFTDLQTVDENGASKAVTKDLPTVAECYSITPISGAKFFYGGPGGCAK